MGVGFGSVPRTCGGKKGSLDVRQLDTHTSIGWRLVGRVGKERVLSLMVER